MRKLALLDGFFLLSPRLDCLLIRLRVEQFMFDFQLVEDAYFSLQSGLLLVELDPLLIEPPLSLFDRSFPLAVGFDLCK